MNADGILDTNTVILLPRLSDPACLPEIPTITAVTLAELSVGPLVACNDAERAARQAHLQQAEADFDPLPFDAAAARAFGQVAADLRDAVVNHPLARTMRRLLQLPLLGVYLYTRLTQSTSQVSTV